MAIPCLVLPFARDLRPEGGPRRRLQQHERCEPYSQCQPHARVGADVGEAECWVGGVFRILILVILFGFLVFWRRRGVAECVSGC